MKKENKISKYCLVSMTTVAISMLMTLLAMWLTVF